MNKIEHFTLADGTRIPSMGFGTYKTENEAVIETAIAKGYRYLDTASRYLNERMVGRGIKASGIAREELWVATKAWTDEMGADEPVKALERSLERLQLDYVDMYLVHWPRGPFDEEWKTTVQETWLAFERLKEEGLAKHIGVCNFLPHHLDVLLANCNEKPEVNQLEIHPGYSQEYAVRYSQDLGILPQAWSPLGRRRLLEDTNLLALAQEYGVSVAQLSLRFLLQKGIMPLAKTSSPQRMDENLAVQHFEISQEHIQMISAMPQEYWGKEHPDFAIPKVKSDHNQ